MEFVFFWETKSPFSQWHPVGFELDGTYFRTAEHYMMWAKAMLFGDEESAQEVLETKHPRDVKAIGRKVKGFDSKVWEENCKQIVYTGNDAKFRQNPEMLEALMSTGTSDLVEASPYDTVWGIGLSADDPLAQDKSTWRGTNYLGEVLTSLREKLRYEGYTQNYKR